MKSHLLLVLPLILVLSCGSDYSVERDLVRRYLVAAAHRDSATIASLTATNQPMEWALSFQRDEPALVNAAAEDMKILFGERRDTISAVEFSFPYEGTGESFGVRFVKRAGTWKISHVQLTDRI